MLDSLFSTSLSHPHLYRFPIATLIVVLLTTWRVHAAPIDGTIVEGNGTISFSDTETVITQTSERLVIEWQNFDLSEGEVVRLVQSEPEAIVLNRVAGAANSSEIAGRIEANGQVFLVNPNGVTLSESATTSVNGLIISELDISPQDFMSDTFIFSARVNTSGAGVINRGAITTNERGNVGLLGQRVINEGTIFADLGSVALAAGRDVSVNFEFNFMAAEVQTAVRMGRRYSLPTLSNEGNITASAGRVLLSASESEAVFGSLSDSETVAGESEVLIGPDSSFVVGRGGNVFNSGTIEVGNFSEDFPQAYRNGGAVVVLGEQVEHSGRISADATFYSAAGTVSLVGVDRLEIMEDSLVTAGVGPLPDIEENIGGNIQLLGRNIEVAGMEGRSRISASGDGHIIIGGKMPGEESRLASTEHVMLGEGSTVWVSSEFHPGVIQIWGKRTVQIDGHLAGGSDVGSHVEVISEGRLGMRGGINVGGSSRGGEFSNGTVLLQAKNLRVSTEGGSSSISEAAFSRTVDRSHMTLKAGNHVTMGTAGSPTLISSMIYSSGTFASRSLRVEAGGNLSLMNLIIEGVPSMSFVADGNVWVSRSRLGALKHWVEFFDDPNDDFPQPTGPISIRAGKNVVISQSEFWFAGQYPQISSSGRTLIRDTEFIDYASVPRPCEPDCADDDY